MGIKSVPEGVSGQPDVALTSLQDGQRLSWDATTSKWTNGKEFITAPTITSPAAGATVTAGVVTTLTCSAFTSPGSLNLVWFDNDWEVATNPSFDNVVYALYNQTGSSTSVSATIPVGYSSVFIRVRQNTVDQKGIWSASVRIIMLQTQYFNASGNFVVPANTNQVTPYLVGGGSGTSVSGIGGGGGGGVSQPGAVAVTPGSTVAVTVGAGNTGATTGGTSTFSSANAAGGAGAGTSPTGKASGNSLAGGTGGTAVGGGGAGAGAVGGNAGGSVNGGSTANGGVGGAGVTITLDGVVRGGGGGGGSNNSGNSLYAHNGGAGGSGGGGAGVTGGSSGGNPSGAATIGTNGTNGLGGGGGGNWGGASNGASTGGNGLVILTWVF